MPGKQAAKRRKQKPTADGAAGSPKSTLPAFGLAEEILGTRNQEQTASIDGQSPILSGSTELAEVQSNDPQSEIGPSETAGGKPEVKSDEAAAELHLVTFLLDREEYGVDIGSVQEVIRVGRIAVVPHARAYIRGVINLRGKVIPVLDLRMRLGLPCATLTKHSRIMVVENGSAVLGVLVDGVSQVLRLPALSVEEPPREENEGTAYVRGIGKAGPRLVLIMDLARALAKDEAYAEKREVKPE